MVTVNPALRELGGYPLARLQDLANELRAAGGELYDFSIGDPEEPTPEPIRQALKDALGPTSRYPTAAGQRATREAVAGWLERRHGVTADPERHVVPTAGSKEAIFHLPLAVVDPHGDRRRVIWGDPGYPVYDRGARFAGGVSHPVPLDHDGGWRLELGELPEPVLREACIAWLNYPHNPTGATVDVDYFRRQLEVARAYDLLLCSDECYQEVWFDRPAPSALEASDGDLANLLAFVSLSKRSGMTGYRAGAIVGDPDLIARMKLLRPNIGTAPQDFVQAAAQVAWADQGHVDERRAVFAAKRRVILDFLAQVGIEVSGSEATFYVWFRAPDGDDAAYAEALLREHVVASPGRSFGPAGTGWLRLALVPSVEGCEAAVRRWGEAIAAGRL